MFGMTVTKDGRTLYLVHYDPVTKTHIPLNRDDMKLLKSQILAEEEFEALKEKVAHPPHRKEDLGP